MVAVIIVVVVVVGAAVASLVVYKAAGAVGDVSMTHFRFRNNNNGFTEKKMC